VPEPRDDYSLIPSDAPTLSAEEELDLAVQDVDFEDRDIETPDLPEPFGRSFAFDHTENRLVRVGTTPAYTRDLDVLKQKILMALRVARGAHTCFTEDFGMNDPYVLIGEFPSAELRSQYARDVEDTLLLLDRVTDVTTEWVDLDPENLELLIVVETDSGEELTVELPVGA
jgi:hypothetical protein